MAFPSEIFGSTWCKPPSGFVQCHPTFPSFNCLKWGCRATIRAAWPKQWPYRNQRSVQKHEKHKKRSGPKKQWLAQKNVFSWKSRKKTNIGRHRYIYMYIYICICIHICTSIWPYNHIYIIIHHASGTWMYMVSVRANTITDSTIQLC